jgi:hypothetical protein
MTKLGLVTAFAWTAAAAAAAPADAPIPEHVQFNRDVRPIMVNTCFKCHGPDLKANKADLRLDLPKEATTPRKNAAGLVITPIVPGRPEASEIWRRITSADPTQVMPPPDSLHLLDARDKEILRRWIAQGAVYQPHWAYLPPQKAEPPAVAGAADLGPIDRFVRAELALRGLPPSPEADRRTLIRRVTLDLIGLPPSVAETEAFVADRRPDAYERLVDRLLASPHYGERMAVAWLDLARFADTVGYHGDQDYNNFPYRDYVIDAFNQDEPFDQFTREQLAGDLLPHPTERQLIATGFNRLNMVTREGGAQPKEYLARYAADRVRTVATTWLGSTMACCECHDHKYDPFKARDFYSLAAYYAAVKQWGVYENYTYTPVPELEGDNNDSPFRPELEVASPYLKARAARLERRCAERVIALGQALAADPAALAAAQAWARSVAAVVRADPQGWTVLEPERAEQRMADATATILPDRSTRLYVPETKINRAGDAATLTLKPAAGPLARVRLEVLPDQAYGGKVNCVGKDTFTLNLEMWVVRAGTQEKTQLHFQDAYCDHPTRSYVNGRLQTTLVAGWTSAPEYARERQTTVYVLDEPFVLNPGDRLVATVTTEGAGRVRLAFSPLGHRLPGLPPWAEADAALLAAEPSTAQRAVIAQEYFAGTQAGHRYDFTASLEDVREIAECRGGRTTTTITAATTPLVTRILPRGNWQDESGPVVQPMPPAFLLPATYRSSEGPRQTRLDLANWLVSRDNPLTARAFMNRLWKQYFGAGLSGVVDDLGSQGEFPSHPELLDWLAVEFMDLGWDVKAMVRELVLSATYRQSSANRPDLLEVDPNNRLLARQTPRRLEAEFVRDNALAAAGLINLDLGGPSVYPYQPAGYYASLQFPDRDYLPDTDERQYRRGLYMHWQRTFLHPMLANFDAPSREECTAARIISSTPQQALTLLNDPTFVEAARGLAEAALAGRAADDFAGGLDEAYRRLLARPPEAREAASLQAFYRTQLDYYRQQPGEADKLLLVGNHRPPPGLDPVRLAAWTSVARVLLNLNETIVRY